MGFEIDLILARYGRKRSLSGGRWLRTAQQSLRKLRTFRRPVLRTSASAGRPSTVNNPQAVSGGPF
jgi:hypothetical protein